MESFHTDSPNRTLSFSSANRGANSPRTVLPAVCVILFCAMMFMLNAVSAKIAVMDFLFMIYDYITVIR